ncbi:hypothetical protein TKK_0015675 [Trichogramma kaykai]
MSDSSDDSVDEDEVFNNFDEEARLIVQTETLPKKSSDRYRLVYTTYKDWEKENAASLSKSMENNLIVYFNQLKVKLKPPTLWSVWSTLRKTLNANDRINIRIHVSKFMSEAPRPRLFSKEGYTCVWDLWCTLKRRNHEYES